ncbi:hypothetical protein [Kribbella sp. NPDC051620]|uniref:hypothetical protein n=1 Tax=Kribbella sp. NPDC051620 TaxID=3364120 RepID=UPI0037AA47D1
MAWIDEFRKLDPRVRETRIAFYQAAAAWTEERYPRKEELIATSGKGQQAFYNQFGPAVQRACIDVERHGTRAVIDQAKSWFVQPWLDGWTTQAQRLRLGPRRRLETLVQISARWAEEYRSLAARDDAALPESLAQAVVRCNLRSHGQPAPRADLTVAGADIVRAAVCFVVRENRPGSVVGALGSVRAAIAALDLDEHGLEGHTWKVIGAISDLMQIWSTTDEDLSPRLQWVLALAIQQLREERSPVPGPAVRLVPPALPGDRPDADRSEEAI